MSQTEPSYNRSELRMGIGHLGLGNFHRAHQAFFIHTMLEDNPGDWMIQGVSMLDHEDGFIKDLQQQDHIYTLIERSGERSTVRRIGSIGAALHAPSGPQKVVEALSSDNIKIISLTVTEKGYGNTPSGELDVNDPAVQSDLQGAVPKTTLGYLHAIAANRMRAGGEGVTVMSCDNLVGNGDMTERLLSQFSGIKDSAVSDWIRSNMSFPNSMVDRITPATTEDTRKYVAEGLGIPDKRPVVCEPYIQWCLEDAFVNGRPELEAYGVQMVPSVKPYEKLKTRLLNGSHSVMAYTAYLMGYRKVDEAMSDPLIAEYLRRYMDLEITRTLDPLPDIDVTDYKNTLLTRFANPAISDRIDRLALDGSAKIGTYIVPPLIENIQDGRQITHAAFALAAWCRFLTGRSESGEVIEIDDPLKDLLQSRAEDPALLLSTPEIFGDQIAGNPRLIYEVKTAHGLISKLGIQAALRSLLGR